MIRSELRFLWIHFLNALNKGENVDLSFPMRVRMTQLPRLLFPANAEFRNFAFKIQAH